MPELARLSRAVLEAACGSDERALYAIHVLNEFSMTLTASTQTNVHDESKAPTDMVIPLSDAGS
jgi:hypothetical protein